MSQPTIHFVYPHRRRISAPHAIGRKLAELLRKDYRVVQHDLFSFRKIDPNPDDVLLGHPVAPPLSCFQRSCGAGWRRVIMMCPFNGHPKDMAYLARVLPECDRFLAITGNYWFERARTDFPTWFPKMLQLDLAVDRADFPATKRSFNPIGRRKFLYIGNLARPKNVPYLSRLAQALPDVEFAWFGGGGSIPHVKSLGYVDFASAEARERAAEYDFLITVGSNDANPTTILEAMSWGLLPVCTPQSGYTGVDGIFNVPLDEVDGALHVLRSLQELPQAELHRLQEANFGLLETRFSWERARRDVVNAIEAPLPDAPELSRSERMRRLLDEISSEAFWLRPTQLRMWSRHALVNALRERGVLPSVT